MKHVLVALSLVALSAPVFAAEVSAPFEQTQFDRVVPDNGSATGGSTKAEGNVWADDYNFVSPAQ
jgi:hypothetical protein